MPKYTQVLRTTATIEDLLKEVIECMHAIDRSYPNQPEWKWREMSVSEGYKLEPNEATTVFYKHARFIGRFYKLEDIEVTCCMLLTSSRQEIDSGLGGTSTKAYPLKIQRVRIFIKHHNHRSRLSIKAKFKKGWGNGVELVENSVTEYVRTT